MTGEQFVKLCYEEKKTILAEYFNPNSSSVVGKKISAITEQGISKDDLYDLLNLVLKENYYTLLLGLDGEASLGNTQIPISFMMKMATCLTNVESLKPLHTDTL